MKKFMFVTLAAVLLLSALAFQVGQVRADDVTPPEDLPAAIRVPVGNVAFLVGHATGTQDYICLPSGTGFKFVLFTPQATLFDDQGGQIITHFFSPNPADNAIRATWQHRDTSTVWAKMHQDPPGTAIVDEKAIAWLLLDVVKAQNGPTGGDMLAKTTFIQRVNTQGGLPPATGCGSSADIGTQAFVPYRADYFFYKVAKGN